MATENRIGIHGLKLETTIGVPDAERKSPQTVSVNVEIVPVNPFDQLGDEIEDTVDYFEVTQVLKRVAGTGERKLIETLADDLAREVFAFNHVESVRIEVRKFILPETDYVSVTTRLSR